MSGSIPFEIQEEIIKRSPVKSLIRFRSVSKQWKYLIHSPQFITHHSLNPTQPHHLLIKYRNTLSYRKYVSIIDDDTFPHHKFSPSVPHTASSVLGCSHGLVCLLAPMKRLVMFWNPSIRKFIPIELPNYVAFAYGFGVCPKTLDPKIVKISKVIKNPHIIEAEVYTLASQAWRNISMKRSPPNKSMQFPEYAIVNDGVLYWVALDFEFYRQRIITFDLTSEKFGEEDLPDSLAGRRGYLNISKLKESLVVLDYELDEVCAVWMLKNGVPKSSFTKLFSVNGRHYRSRIVGFRKNGQLIDDCDGELKVYEPGSEHMNGLGIYGSLFEMASYTESLLLLNHPGSIIQW